jgi:hypothetical protein
VILGVGIYVLGIVPTPGQGRENLNRPLTPIKEDKSRPAIAGRPPQEPMNRLDALHSGAWSFTGPSARFLQQGCAIYQTNLRDFSYTFSICQPLPSSA